MKWRLLLIPALVLVVGIGHEIKSSSPQLQQSGGSGGATNITQFGGTNVSTGVGASGVGIPRVTISNDSSLAANQSVNVAQINGVAPTMGNGASGTGVPRVTLASDSTGQVTLAAGSQAVGSITNTGFALNAGTANIGFVRILPSSCTQSTNFAPAPTVGVATGAGTSITSTTTCITFCYANNITNSTVTLRLQDKSGTPIIWVGGNADYSIPANSNVRVPCEGVLFTGGITAIAGTASAINLQVNGVQ